MEITVVSKNSIKIKGKLGSIVIDPPTGKSGISADAILLLSSHEDSFGVEGSRLLMSGPGEYEVAGIKINGLGVSGDSVYSMRVDNITIVIGKSDSLLKFHDKFSECEVLIVEASGQKIEPAVTGLAPKVVVLYGDFASEAKSLGKEELKPVSKYVTTLEKLPQDMEVVILE